MADLNERLDRLIADQDSMKKVLEMARTILAQRDSSASESAAQATPSAPPEAEGKPELSALLSAALSQSGSSTGTPPPEAPTAQADMSQSADPGIPALAAILPQLMQAMSGQGNLIKQERVTLLQAMRPYMKESRLSSLDRALRMANMTKAAANVLHTLGR